MNLDAVRDWVVALRSGEYQQTFNRFYWTDVSNEPDGTVVITQSFCAVGVLIDVCQQQGWLKPQIEINDSTYSEMVDVLDADYEELNSVIRLNDKQLWDFGKIADALEEDYGLRDE